MGPFLAIETATRTACVALGGASGALVADETWTARYLHGERLLAAADRVLAAAALGLRDLGAIVVGTGPGAFTGLRVGMATAKGLAYGLGIPIVGIETARALALAALSGAPGGVLVATSAGPFDRHVAWVSVDTPATVRLEGAPRLVPGGEDPFADAGHALVVAVDLDDAPAAAREAGRRAQAGLGRALVRLGAARLERGESDDLAELAPVYVTLPRGVHAEVGQIAWSRDLR